MTATPGDDASVQVQLIGPEGLAVEVVGHVLSRAGVAVASPEQAEVIVLVDPAGDDWATSRVGNLPIVLVHEGDSDDATVLRAVLSGADAVLAHDVDAATVRAAVTGVAAGGTLLDAAQVRTLATLARTAARDPAVSLSCRESQILASIADGKAVKQTARDLGITPKTVENLQGRLFRKLSARNRAQAVTRAHVLGLL